MDVKKVRPNPPKGRPLFAIALPNFVKAATEDLRKQKPKNYAEQK
jgi:hypothetical protein